MDGSNLGGGQVEQIILQAPPGITQVCAEIATLPMIDSVSIKVSEGISPADNVLAGQLDFAPLAGTNDHELTDLAGAAEQYIVVLQQNARD
jgi:hypothetical protein